MSNSIEEILQRLLNERLRKNPHKPFYFGSYRKELEALLTEARIGEDEPNPRKGAPWAVGFEFRNKLKAKQRQTWNKIKGGEKVYDRLRRK